MNLKQASLRRLARHAVPGAWVPRLSGLGFLGVLAGLLFFGAMFWAKGRDPFERLWFRVKVPGQGKVECVAVLPKGGLRSEVQSPRSKAQSARSGGEGWPVVVYLHGAGGSLLGSGNELRQMAEMGLAAVGMEYCQTNEAVCEAQLSALLDHLGRQRWADMKRVAWVGYSLGAQRLLSFGLRHPDVQPRLLVRLAGGWVPELQSEVQGPKSKVQGAKSKVEGPAPAAAMLLVHGDRDEVFPLAQAEGVAACLRTNGVPVELRVLPGEGHGFGGNRLLVFRVIGEQCLTRLKGPGALRDYRSILSWQAGAKPLWVFWLPALAWVALWLWLRRCAASWQPKERGHSCPPGSRPGSGGQECPRSNATEDSRERSSDREARGEGALRWWEVALRWLAAVLAVAALAVTALHVVPPRLPAGQRTLALARKHLVQATEVSDFDFLSAQPIWRGKPLKTLLEHVELANYNRELINWKVEEQVYRDYVLSPRIDPAADGELNWRRTLWENFYPRIRREQDPQAAAEVVVRFLRERVCDRADGPTGRRQSATAEPGAAARATGSWRRWVLTTVSGCLG